MVLEKVERDPPILVNSHYFTIEQRIGWQPFTCLRNTWELRGEVVSTTRPECHAVLALASDAAVAIKFDFVEPLVALRDVLDGESVHWLDEIDSGGVSSSCFHLGIV